MEERLEFIFANVNEWLKFAEAKNGVLIAFNGAAIWGTLQSFEDICKINPRLEFLLWIYIGTSLTSIVVSFFSFMPTLTLSNKPVKPIAHEDVKNHSLIFFRHIARFNPDEYLRVIYQRSNTPLPQSFDRIELDISYQIISNSRTTWLKYQIFFLALNITLIGMILPIPFLIIFWLIKLKKK